VEVDSRELFVMDMSAGKLDCDAGIVVAEEVAVNEREYVHAACTLPLGAMTARKLSTQTHMASLVFVFMERVVYFR
jgi:hypothetical protein